MSVDYKIGIIGFGSIATRHLHNIDKVLAAKGCTHSIDVIRSGKGGVIDNDAQLLIENTYYSYVQVPDDYDILFITNPTALHYSTIRKYASKTKHMFIEKPVFDSSSLSLEELNLDPNMTYYVACPLRYSHVVQYIKNQCDLTKIYSVRAICSSYLPEWRPHQDYRKSYSAHTELGGGVSIDLIHEWDYLTYLFGYPEQLVNFRGTFSDLEINSDDLSIYIAKYPNLAVEVHLDYFGRVSIREIQLFSADDTIVGDFIKNEIRFLKTGKIIPFEESRNDYHRKEIEHFFSIIEGFSQNDNSIATALKTLDIAGKGK
ncbi:Gfo/Idh/MocA family oxidoreductase [Sphaerochaeta sp. PS]|uniref:Gfo/Idh/MocA family protein n=1 Tax=Sphaerochaeta sp. PS TaxID=3076336 RepID=UPI0028A35C69|nr:Gfo/Idh/MocA family oxidoreductase [Sphaerochaeta sp. PS]MDT4763430.1 Gfo/Idh/MocA family oxidoreductase [Sphaerochaeta sp. PS]